MGWHDKAVACACRPVAEKERSRSSWLPFAQQGPSESTSTHHLLYIEEGTYSTAAQGWKQPRLLISIPTASKPGRN